jgi:hypothetical protein
MGNSVLRYLVKGILGRLLAYGALAAGFLLIYRGFQAGDLGTGVPLGLGGGVVILIGMYLMVTVRHAEPPMAPSDKGQLDPDNQEDSTGDPIDRSNKGG